MSIRDCPTCQGIGWIPGGYMDKNWHPLLRVPGGPLHAIQWELCWCNQGTIVKGPPAFWMVESWKWVMGWQTKKVSDSAP